MTVPAYQDMMLPVLRGISDRRTYSIVDLVKIVAKQMRLTEGDLDERIANGTTTKMRHRLTWVKYRLKELGLVSSPARGMVAITDDGLEVLKDNPKYIDLKFLARRGEEREEESGDGLDPEERIDVEYKKVENALKDELLERVKNLSPSGFERMVLDLCAKMNSSVSDVRHTGGPGDRGIDGIILDGEFQLDKIYIQAKRHATTVSKDQVMAFVGALGGKATKKGIFITTANIPESARKEVGKNEAVSVRLVDGDALVGLMIKHDAGVVVDRKLTIKKINMDYFDGFDG